MVRDVGVWGIIVRGSAIVGGCIVVDAVGIVDIGLETQAVILLPYFSDPARVVFQNRIPQIVAVGDRALPKVPDRMPLPAFYLYCCDLIPRVNVTGTTYGIDRPDIGVGIVTGHAGQRNITVAVFNAVVGIIATRLQDGVPIICVPQDPNIRAASIHSQGLHVAAANDAANIDTL